MSNPVTEFWINEIIVESFHKAVFVGEDGVRFKALDVIRDQATNETRVLLIEEGK